MWRRDKPHYYRWDPGTQQVIPVWNVLEITPYYEDEEYFEKYRRVALDEFETPYGHARVSTVFLCIDHQFGDGPPVLWETMVFGGIWDECQWRYTSRKAAEESHKRVVEAIKAGRDPGTISDADTPSRPESL